MATLAGPFTCEGRMNWKQTVEGGSLSELDACRFVSDEQDTICGPDCHPEKVSVRPYQTFSCH